MSSFTYNTRLALAGGALALAGGVLGAGCGSDTPVDYTLESTFCQQIAQADCSPVAVGACYGASDATLQTDTDSCIKVRGALEHCNPRGLAYHAAFAQPCVDAHAAVYASNPLDPGALAAMAQACSAVLNNGGTQGAPCTADNDCAYTGDSTGFSCVLHQGKGSCQVPVQVSAGGKCTDPAAQCSGDNYCDAGGHCVMDSGNGEACGSGVSCASKLRCDAKASTCAPLISDGNPCVAASDCVGQFCVGPAGGSVCTSTFMLALLSPTCSDFK